VTPTALTYGDLRKAFRDEPIGYGTIPGAQIRQILETSVSYVMVRSGNAIDSFD